MIYISYFCDLCKKPCDNECIDLDAVLRKSGYKPLHSNRTIQVCPDCFHDIFNKNFDIEFVSEDEIEDGFYE